MRVLRDALWALTILIVAAGCGENGAPKPEGQATPSMAAEKRKAVQQRGAGQAGVPVTLTNSIGMKLVYIKPGSFMMGSPTGKEKRSDVEGPQHRVTITKGFYMGAYEVTQEQYERVMGTNPSRFKKGGNYPVEKVSWDDAVEFCKKLSAQEGKTYRLPTEAEWEYACRAGTTTPFAFGNTISTDQANYDGDYTYVGGRKGKNRKCTTPVGTFQPNAWGLYDMHGNVWEWCGDWYAKDYYGRSPETDPQGPTEADATKFDWGSGRVLRGGSWCSFPYGCRSAYRLGLDPSLRFNFSGFRVVCSPRLSE